jgi:riboflavin kinase
LGTLKFTGAVFTGEGNGKKFLQFPWVQQQIKEKLGFAPFLGTLNLKLTDESLKQKSELNKSGAIVICPAEGYCIGLLFRAVMEGRECAVILPQVPNYPKNVLEVIAPVNLRDAAGLKDGDMVTVEASV